MVTCSVRLCVVFKIAEICRVLRSGGVFVGTTFLRYSPSTPWMIRPFQSVKRIVMIKSGNSMHRF